MTRRWGLWIAMAAVAVATPRLVLTLLAGDRISLGPTLTAWLIAISGAGAAVVLSAGQLYIVHVIGEASRRMVLALLWAGVLAMTAVIVTPMIVAGLEARTLPQVLTEPWKTGWRSRWIWATVAVLAVELAAAVCVYADRLHARDAEQRAALHEQLASMQELARAQQALLAEHAAGAGTAASTASSRNVPCRNGCGYTGTAMGERAHQRYCTTKVPHA